MAKSRAQRKAEQAKRRQQELEDRARAAQSKAQHDTQVPESGEVAEVEAAMEASAERADALAPSRADVGKPAEGDAQGEDKSSRRERRKAEKEQEKEQERKARESAERRAPKELKAERERGRVMTFFAQVVAELRKVQWPDRETLIQASAVTLLFVAVAAAYLGVLDAIFGWLVDLFIT